MEIINFEDKKKAEENLHCIMERTSIATYKKNVLKKVNSSVGVVLHELDVGIHHLSHQLVKLHLGFPPQRLLRFRAVA